LKAPDPIVLSIELAATPERAYCAFTTRFEEWWPVATHSLSRSAGTRCRFDATPGGALEEVTPEGARHA
jgi:hypothetical protein